VSGLRVEKFTSHSELEEITIELDALGADHKDVLGPSQQAAIAEARERVALRVKALEAEATRWLVGMEGEVGKTKDLNRLAEQIGRLPEFLTEEGRARLQQVTSQLNERREEARKREEAKREEDRKRDEAKREEDRKREAARQEEESGLRTLAAIGLKGPLVQLRQGLELVGSMVSGSPRVQTEQAKKRAALESAKAELESFAAGLEAELDLVASSDDLNRLRTVIDKKESFFGGSPEMSHIEKARARCEAIADLLKDLAATGASPLDTPDSCRSCFEKLAKAKESYAGRVSERQIALVTRAEESMHARVQGQEQKARQWLADARRSFAEGCDLSRMLDRLSSPPAFLPGASQSELEGLRTDVRIAQEKDICGQVRELFARINDKAVREQLLEELRALLRS